MTGQLQLLPLDQLVPAKDNPRRDVGDVTELAASIKSVGLIEPLIATTNGKDGKLLLVAGSRRLAAARQAGLENVPVIVRSLTETQRIEAMLIENIQRQDLDPIEEANAFKKLFDLGYSEHKLAERIGRSQSHISKRISLLKLPAPALKALDDGKLSLPEAYELTKLAEHPDRVQHAITERSRNGYYRDMKQVVDSELEILKRDRTAAATRARLQSEGVKLLKDVEGAYSHPPGATPLGTGWQHLDIPLSEHKKAPCHRATVVKSTGEAMYLCVDPASHLKKLKGPEKQKLARNLPQRVAHPGADAKEKAKRQAEELAANEAAAARKKLLVGALKGRAAKAVVGHVLHQLTLDLIEKDMEVLDIAAELLGLDESKYAIGKALEKLALKSSDQLLRVALALSFATGELQLADGWGGKPVLERHLAYLKKLGYKPTAIELKAVKAAR